MRRTSSLATAIALLALALGGCRSALLPGDEVISDGGDAAAPRDFATADLTRLPDLSVCLPPGPDPGPCPCGTNGLCRAPTGRLVVQTQSQGGNLRVVVMDDNGCRRFEVSSELPLGTPKWAADRERIAFVSGKGQSATLHVVRVAASGQVTCRASFPTGLQVTDVAWATPKELWLFEYTTNTIYRWELGKGLISKSPMLGIRADALGDGPIAVVERACDSSGVCRSRPLWRGQALSGAFIEIEPFTDMKIGPVRLDRGAPHRLTYELDGVRIADAMSGKLLRFGTVTDRSPAFALGGAAIVHTTDDGDLRYRMLVSDGGPDVLTIPRTWRNVFSPDWSPPAFDCQPRSDCF